MLQLVLQLAPIQIKYGHSRVSYQQRIDKKYDLLGHESPSGYGPLQRLMLEWRGFTMAARKDRVKQTPGEDPLWHRLLSLGVVLDENLCHNGYIDSVYRKINTKLRILSRIRCFISEKTAASIYKTLTTYILL